VLHVCSPGWLALADNKFKMMRSSWTALPGENVSRSYSRLTCCTLTSQQAAVWSMVWQAIRLPRRRSDQVWHCPAGTSMWPHSTWANSLANLSSGCVLQLAAHVVDVLGKRGLFTTCHYYVWPPSHVLC